MNTIELALRVWAWSQIIGAVIAIPLLIFWVILVIKKFKE
jgi:flagellar biogenesis protein FliO